MIEQWLEWAQGPMFRLVSAIMVLGLLRLFILNIIQIVTVTRMTSNKKIPYQDSIRETLGWIFPTPKVFSNRLLFTATSFLFHMSIIIVPIFLGAHILLWGRILGFQWPAVNNTVMDYLTILAIITSLALFIQRISAKATRDLSRFQDYALPLLIAMPFVSGFLAMHPSMNPFNYQVTMLVHILSADLVILLIPFTKLAHMILWPTNRLVSALGWHFMADGPEKVTRELGKEGIPI